ncbi:HAD family hydrolase [Alicyclobacillus sp. SP_1]|uniref:HAD family hydrolase n=1 Tax=Alicyclobacillus sp. SP_1 TaxID=2942475 RepID=UPI002157A0CA|nr:HAD family hydrolase [Alicyclobacillus sp. SP_1]
MFRTVLFDVDGVLLSEERYFDATALTVHELCFSANFLDLAAASTVPFTPAPTEAQMRAIRTQVMDGDRALHHMKSRGINANWDMVYLLFAWQFAELCRFGEVHRFHQVTAEDVDQRGSTTVKKTLRDGGARREKLRVWMVRMAEVVRAKGAVYHPDFHAFVEVVDACSNKSELFAAVNSALQTALGAHWFASLPEDLWELGREVFQQWYLGDEYLMEQSSTSGPLDVHKTGKRGFLRDEVAIVDMQKLADILKQLAARGVTLGIATGRPELETKVPLEALGILSYFDANRISTASDVLVAEAECPQAAPLSKPHPYSYLRSLMGRSQPAELLETVLPVPREVGEATLIVGDSVADALAARALGCRFAAVLTGPAGDLARKEFEDLQADYILADVLELAKIGGCKVL